MQTDRKVKVGPTPAGRKAGEQIRRSNSKSNGKPTGKKTSQTSARSKTAKKQASGTKKVTRRAQEELIGTRQRLLVAYEHAPIGIAECSPEGKYVNCNEEFCRLTGYNMEEIRNLGMQDITYEEDYIFDIKLHQRLVAGDIPFYKLEKRMIRKDGQIIWVELTRNVVRDSDGKALFTIGAVVDVTERKKAEEALRSARESAEQTADQMTRLQQITAALTATATPAQLAHTVIEQGVRAANATAGILVELIEDGRELRTIAAQGYPAAALRSEPVPLSDPTPMSDCIRTGQAVWIRSHQEFADRYPALAEHRRGLGNEATAAIPLIVGKRVLGGLAFSFADKREFNREEREFFLAVARQGAQALERARAEDALRESEERFRSLANAMPSIVWTAAPDGTITYANDQWFHYAGITPEENARHWPELVLHPDDYERCVREWTDALKTVPDQYLVEVRNRRYDGEYRWFQTRAVPVRDASGKATAWYGVTTDIHERIEAENRLALLAEISDMLRNFEDPYELMYMISKAVGEHLHAKRALFNEIDLEHDREIVHRDYHNGLDSVAGVHKASEYSNITSAEVASGKTVVNTDSKADSRTAADYEKVYALTGERAYVAVPMMRENRWVASFWVSDDAPRQWSKEEVSLLEAIAERTWTVIEKLRIAEELRAHKAELEAIITETPFMLTRCTRDLRYRFVSRAYAERIGRTPEDVAGKPIVEIMGEESLKAITPYIEKVLEGQRVEYESEVSFLGGRTPFLHVVYTPDWDEEGNVLGWFASIVDISERKYAEEALRTSEERIRLATDAAGMYAWEFDVQEQTFTVSDNFSEVLGFSADLLPQNSLEALHYLSPAEDAQHVQEAMANAFERHEDLRDLQYRIVNPENGQVIWVEVNARTIFDADGKPQRMFGVSQNITGRKRAEEALRASEALYRTIARSIPGGGVYVIDKDFRYVVAEGPVTEAFGLSREILEGHTVSEVFPTEAAERMKDRLQQNFAGETVSFETKHNGRVYWTQQAPLLDPPGHAIILTLDITERKQTEEALRQSEERFVRFMQHLPGLAWIKDMQGRYIYANAAAEEAFHTPREALYGKTDLEVFPPEVAVQFRENDERAQAEGKGIQVVETLKHEDGTLHYSLVSKFPIPGPDGNTILIGGTAFDITERLQAEEALGESEERFSAILRQATAGIVRKDAKGQLVFVNEAFCNMLGYTEAELLGKTVWEFMHEEDVAENKRSYHRLMQEGAPFKLERRFVRKDGSVIWVDASVSPIMGATGKPQSAVTVEVNITRRKKAEQALHEINTQLEDRIRSRTAELQIANQTLIEEINERKQAEEALRESREHLQVLSKRLVEVQEEERRAIARELHDRVGQTLAALNINLIIMNSQLLEDSKERIGSRMSDSMQLVTEAITLIRSVMTDLRPAVLDDYGLQAALQAYTDEYKSRYGIKVILNQLEAAIPRLDPGLEMTVLRIAQEALTNVARHASAEQVYISLQLEDHLICLTVQDDGVGMEAGNGASRAGSHGLKIMRERAEAFGGSVHVSPAPGKGTRVEARIPVQIRSQAGEEIKG